jgi:dTDP-4-dehydrorhamnose 3,5-epimerase-like enzyme
MSAFPKLSLRRLPRFRVPLERPVLDGGVIEMPAGDFIQVANREAVRFVAHLEFRAGAHASRGNHYHLVKTETLTVIRGRLRARYADVDTGERHEVVLEAGDQVRVAPRCAHSYSGLEASAAIEWASHDFDPADAIAYPFE